MVPQLAFGRRVRSFSFARNVVMITFNRFTGMGETVQPDSEQGPLHEDANVCSTCCICNVSI